MRHRLRSLRWLLPSFLTSSPSSGASSTSNIAALDGVRGIACLIVFNEHVSYGIISSYFVHGFGLEGSYFPSQLPFIRLFLSGLSMVNIFYVLSGYVLSTKILRQMMIEHDHDNARFSILKASLKRAPRLYIPTLVVWFGIALAAQLGLYDAARVNFDAKDDPNVTTWGLSEPPPRRHPTLWLQLRDATLNAKTLFTFLFKWIPEYPTGDYDKHTWTIVIEMRTSMILFAALWVSSGLPSRQRAVAFAGVLFCAVWVQHYEIACFFSGALLAMSDVAKLGTFQQLPLARDFKSTGQKTLDTPPETPRSVTPSPPPILPSTTTNNNTATSSPTNTTATSSPYHLPLLLLSLYLLAAPIRSMAFDPFYSPLYPLHPDQGPDEAAPLRLLGSTLLVYLTLHHRATTSLFTSRLARYMGRVSFPFYLLHGPVIRCVQYGMVSVIWGLVGVRGGVNTYVLDGAEGQGRWVKVGRVGSWNSLGAWVVSVVACLPVSVWLADLVERAVDRRVVRLVREGERWGERWWRGDGRRWRLRWVEERE